MAPAASLGGGIDSNMPPPAVALGAAMESKEPEDAPRAMAGALFCGSVSIGGGSATFSGRPAGTHLVVQKQKNMGMPQQHIAAKISNAYAERV